jgi:hypothetical protein
MLQSPRQYRVISFSSVQLHPASARKGVKSPSGNIRLRNLLRPVFLQSPKSPFLLQRPWQLWVLLLPQAEVEEKKGKHSPTSQRYKQNKEKHKYNERMEQYEKIKNLQLVADVSCRKE